MTDQTTKATHTPGPWKPRIGGFADPNNRADILASDGEPFVLARVIALGADDAAGREAEANARIIAAAPDLLAEHYETAERLRDLADSLTSDDGLEDVVQALNDRADSIDAAIAKATNQEPTP